MTGLALLNSTQTTLAFHWHPMDGPGEVLYVAELLVVPKAGSSSSSQWETIYEVPLCPCSSQPGAPAAPHLMLLLVQGPRCVCTARNLQPGKRHQLRVHALNTAGPSLPGRALHVSTAATVPDTPGAPHATQRLREALHLGWAAPAYDGGAAVHSYRLEQCQGEPLLRSDPPLDPFPSSSGSNQQAIAPQNAAAPLSIPCAPVA